MATMGSAYVYGLGAGSVNREDVMNAIVNADPFDTPLLNMAPKVPANHTTVEWLEHSLDNVTAITGGRPEGQAFTADTVTAPSRKTNITQIFGQHVVVSETQQVVSPYGFSDTFLYEVMRKTRNVMRGIEQSLFRASGSSATGQATSDTAGTARVMKSIQDFLATATGQGVNNKHADASALGGGDVTASAMTLRERAVNTFLQLLYGEGGNPTHIFASPAVKRSISAFDGSIIGQATAMTVNINATEQQIVRSVNQYVSDFGVVNVVLDRWVPQSANTGTGANAHGDNDGTLFFLELPRIQIAFLRPIRFKRLAEDGDRVRGMVIGELTLKVLAHKVHGKIYGVDNLV